MLSRVLLVTAYIVSCLKIRTAPWRYFQLNAGYFSSAKGIFSKIDIDALIPERWRLAQALDDGMVIPDKFPVFVKPEWGQNALGISRADNEQELASIRKIIAHSKTAHIIQQAAPESKEYELFTIPSHKNNQHYAILTLVQTCNTEECNYPINGINNKNTTFHEITAHFNQEQRDKIWSYVRALGEFRISRVCVRANSEQALVDGNFHLIEINLFVPMPLNLLDKNLSFKDKLVFIRKSMQALAQNTKTLPRPAKQNAIVLKKLLYQRKTKSLHLKRSRETL